MWVVASYSPSSDPSVPPEPLRFESVRLSVRSTLVPLTSGVASVVPFCAAIAAFPKLTFTIPLDWVVTFTFEYCDRSSITLSR